jgi:predicted DNA binding CopG/RHH family protein
MTKTRFPDPYEGMSDDALDRYFSNLITSHRKRQQAVSIRFPEELLGEIRQLARELGVGYQTLTKNLLERDVAQLRARRSGRRRPVTSAPATAARTSHRGTPAAKHAVRSSTSTSKKRTKSRQKVPA